MPYSARVKLSHSQVTKRLLFLIRFWSTYKTRERTVPGFFLFDNVNTGLV